MRTFIDDEFEEILQRFESVVLEVVIDNQVGLGSVVEEVIDQAVHHS